MKVSSKILMVSIAIASLASCSKKGPYLQNDQPKESQFETAGKSGSKEEAIVVKARGDINAALDQFRDLLGGGQPNTVPGAVGGRREVNWDAVPANLTNNNSFPGFIFSGGWPGSLNSRRFLLMTSIPAMALMPIMEKLFSPA